MGIIIRPKSMAYKDPQTGQYTEIDVVGGYTPIVGTETKYQVSNSGTTVPTGTWLENIPTVPQGKFLWMRTALKWNNGVVSYLYSATRQGRDGLGSVSSVNSLYPDGNGNVNLGDIVHTVNGTAPDSAGNVALGSLVKQVNSISPDSSGNVSLGDIVHKVNNVSPDSSGNVALPVDAAPTDGSSNPVSSNGVYDALAGKQDTLTIDAAPTAGSSNPVSSDGVYDALAGKQDTLTIDAAPTAGSSNPVSSGGAYTALAGKVNKAGDVMTGTLILTNNSGPRDSGSPQIGFYFDENDWVANIQYTTNKHFCFIERDASDNSIREQFYLPEITSTSGTHYYGILTSKTFNPGEDFTSKVTFNVAAAHATFYRVGNLCMVAYQSNGQTFPVNTQLFALPNGYRPSTQTFAVCSVNTSTYGLVCLNANGNVNVSQIADGTVNGRLYLNCVYVI